MIFLSRSIDYSIGGQTGEAAPLIVLRCFFVFLKIEVIIFEDIKRIIIAK